MASRRVVSSLLRSASRLRAASLAAPPDGGLNLARTADSASGQIESSLILPRSGPSCQLGHCRRRRPTPGAEAFAGVERRPVLTKMAMFSSSRLALRRAASLGAGLFHAVEDPFPRRLLHGQLLPRSFASDASGHNRPFPPSGSGILADMDQRQNFNRFDFVRQDSRPKAQVSFNNTDNGAAMSRTANGEKPLGLREGLLFSSSPFTKDREQYSKKKRDFVHVLLKRK